MFIKNLFQYTTFIKAYQFNNNIRILLKVEVLFKHVAYIVYRSATEHMGIKIREIAAGK